MEIKKVGASHLGAKFSNASKINSSLINVKDEFVSSSKDVQDNLTKQKINQIFNSPSKNVSYSLTTRWATDMFDVPKLVDRERVNILVGWSPSIDNTPSGKYAMKAVRITDGKVMWESDVIPASVMKGTDGKYYVLGWKKGEEIDREKAKIFVVNPSNGEIEKASKSFRYPMALKFCDEGIYIVAQDDSMASRIKGFFGFGGDDESQALYQISPTTLEVRNKWKCPGDIMSLDDEAGMPYTVTSKRGKKGRVAHVSAYRLGRNFKKAWDAENSFYTVYSGNFGYPEKLIDLKFTKDLVIVASEKQVVAFSKEDGSLRWKHEMEGSLSVISKLSLSPMGDKVYFYALSGKPQPYLIGLDATIGKERVGEKVNLYSGISPPSPLVAPNGTVYNFGTFNVKVYDPSRKAVFKTKDDMYIRGEPYDNAVSIEKNEFCARRCGKLVLKKLTKQDIIPMETSESEQSKNDEGTKTTSETAPKQYTIKEGDDVIQIGKVTLKVRKNKQDK